MYCDFSLLLYYGVSACYIPVCVHACVCVGGVKNSKDFVSKGHGDWPEECQLYRDLI